LSVDESGTDEVVRSLFKVTDEFIMEDGAHEYTVVYDDEGSRRAFKTLCERLRPLGYLPRVSGTKERALLTVTKNPATGVQGAARRSPIFLVLLSLVSIVATGWVVGDIYAVVLGASPVLSAVTFVAGVTAVLLAHEVVQRLVARRQGRLSTIPFYIPNLPLFAPYAVLYFLPAFGSISSLRSPTLDKDSLFDFYLFPAVAGAAVAIVVALFGSSTAVVLTHVQYLATFSSGSVTTLSTNPSLLQLGAIFLVGAAGLSPSIPAGGVTLFSPLEIAAWVGLLISFVSLMPAALFDGGRMATLALGGRGSRITTLVTGLLLLAIDLPNYWGALFLIFLSAAIRPSNETLDSISAISRSRKLLFLGVIALALLCIPIPQSFLNIPL
jgi:membrane-associated protease RseP (regulator of RpoE activity)